MTMLYFPIVNSHIYVDISESPAYGVFVSQLIRYAKICSKYEDYLFKGSILVSNLLSRLFGNFRLFFRKFYGRHTYLMQIMFPVT